MRASRDPRTKPTTAAIVLVLAVATYACPARADDKVAAAQALFDEARALMAKGDYPAACAKFEGSQSLDPGAGTEYNLALCYEKAGRTASAWATYLSAATSYHATNRADWETRAREHASALEGKLSRLTIKLAPGAPSGAQVTRDGAAVVRPEVGVAIPVDPGTHVVTANADGRTEWKNSVNVTPGASAVVEIPAVWGERSSGVAPPAKAAVESSPSEQRSGRRTLAFVAGGAGIVALGLGTVAGLVAMQKNSTSEKDCPSDGICKSAAALDANDSARTWATVSTAGFVAAGVLLAAGVVLYLTDTPASARSRAALRLVPRAGGHAGAW